MEFILDERYGEIRPDPNAFTKERRVEQRPLVALVSNGNCVTLGTWQASGKLSTSLTAFQMQRTRAVPESHCALSRWVVCVCSQLVGCNPGQRKPASTQQSAVPAE